jgi:hypothetical protein
VRTVPVMLPAKEPVTELASDHHELLDAGGAVTAVTGIAAVTVTAACAPDAASTLGGTANEA